MEVLQEFSDWGGLKIKFKFKTIVLEINIISKCEILK